MSAIATLNDLPPVSKYGPEDDNREDFTRSATYLPRIQFFSDQAAIVKKKQFPANHFASVMKKDDMKDLGETFPAIPLAYRYKAIDFREQGKVKSYYDPKSAEFLEVKADAAIKRPPGEKAKTMAGVEFLLYTPDAGFVTLLCSSASLKVVANKLFPQMRQFVSFGHKLVESGSFIYEAPEVTVFSGSFDLPDATKMTKTIAEFNAAAGKKVEKDDEPEVEGTEEGRTR